MLNPPSPTTAALLSACLLAAFGCQKADTGETAPPTTTDSGPTLDTSDLPPLEDGEVYLDDTHLLIVPSYTGIALYTATGELFSERRISQLVESCPDCNVLGTAPDGDGLLFAWAIGAGASAPGGYSRVTATGVEYSVADLGFPHDATRDPITGDVIVPEASLNRLVWLPGDGSSSTPVAILDSAVPDFTETLINSLQVLEQDGRVYAIFSNRGAITPPTGRISMWDITDRDAPSLMWKYPAVGFLDTPHGPLLREVDDQWWLVYAHTYGAGEVGTVGIAVTANLRTVPSYVADATPPPSIGDLTFMRSAELTTDRVVVGADTGATGGATSGKIFRFALPELEPSGLSGARGEQLFVEMEEAELLVSGLDSPYEAYLWRPTFAL